MLKMDFQRAVLNRIPHIAKNPSKEWRPILFVCDEYQELATVGVNEPSGDEKFFSLSRQAKCVPLVATQSISSLQSTSAWGNVANFTANLPHEDLLVVVRRLLRKDCE